MHVCVSGLGLKRFWFQLWLGRNPALAHLGPCRGSARALGIAALSSVQLGLGQGSFARPFGGANGCYENHGDVCDEDLGDGDVYVDERAGSESGSSSVRARNELDDWAARGEDGDAYKYEDDDDGDDDDSGGGCFTCLCVCPGG